MINKIKCKVVGDNGYKVELIRPNRGYPINLGAEVTLVVERNSAPEVMYDEVEEDVPDYSHTIVKGKARQPKRRDRKDSSMYIDEGVMNQ